MGTIMDWMSLAKVAKELSVVGSCLGPVSVSAKLSVGFDFLLGDSLFGDFELGVGG